jgi:DNA (cytosine-5)-methyltransferase 1
MSSINIATLFSGIGAPEQGARRVYDEVHTVFACEYDKFARQSYEANYSIDPLHFHKDVNDLDATPYQGKVDVIVGGSPCQDFSIAGLRDGVDGKRGQLIWQFFRVIKEANPPIFVYENVKGMVSDKNGQTLKDFLAVFRSIGYHCHQAVINTKHYGVPQNRERIYIVGFLDADIYHNFTFADTIPLETRLKDILENEVDEKYYLSQKTLKGFQSHSAKHLDRGNGFKFQPTNGGGYCDVPKHKSREQTHGQLSIKGYP